MEDAECLVLGGAPVEDERDAEHDGGLEDGGVAPVALLDHGGLVGEGVGVGVADSSAPRHAHRLGGGQYSNGAEVQWCNGAMVQWCNGKLVKCGKGELCH